MRSVIVLSALLLVAAVAAASWALVPACGFLAPVLGRVGICPLPDLVTAESRRAALDARAASLADEVAALERELAAIQCTRVFAEAAPAPDPTPAPEAPQVPAELPPIDAQAWQSGNIAALEGCWALDSSFETTNQTTHVTSHYSEWTMCFDSTGAGQEEMHADTGAVCAGPVTARFQSAGTLLIEEPANLQCSDGAYIFRLVSSCTLTPAGQAICRTTQPEIGSSGSVSFRRAPGAE